MEKIRDRIWNLLGFLPRRPGWGGERMKALRDEFYFEPCAIDSSGSRAGMGKYTPATCCSRNTEETVYIRDNGSKLLSYTLTVTR